MLQGLSKLESTFVSQTLTDRHFETSRKLKATILNVQKFQVKKRQAWNGQTKNKEQVSDQPSMLKFDSWNQIKNSRIRLSTGAGC